MTGEDIDSSMAGEDLVELKVRLADGTSIGPSKYSSSATAESLKEKIISQWPKDKENGPKTVKNVQLIHAGKILENNRTIAESRLPVIELPGSVITMHVVLRPSLQDKKTDKLQSDSLNKIVKAFLLVFYVFLLDGCQDAVQKRSI